MISSGSGDATHYEAHSVVEDANGLFDITLPDSTACVSIDFLSHVGTDEEFWSAVKRCPQTYYPFPTPEETSSMALDVTTDEDDPPCQN